MITLAIPSTNVDLSIWLPNPHRDLWIMSVMLSGCEKVLKITEAYVDIAILLSDLNSKGMPLLKAIINQYKYGETQNVTPNQ